MTKALALIAALALTACAKSPESILPAQMPGAYDNLPCRDVASTIATVTATLSAQESAQRAAVAGDAFGVFLIGVPTSSLLGGDQSADIAISRGRLVALESRRGQC